jgi:amino acid transporter
MSQGKKFGTFAGVFTPSILTILGVIMYLRMGWVVGNTGLWGTIIVVLGAHIISISTGLSISSISTDKKVGAGGVYYVLSRSLGLPIGGALGMTLFVATALSISLYMVGFAEIFNDYWGIGYVMDDAGQMVRGENFKNSIRLTGSLGLLGLTIIAFISTSIALKAQFFILGAIVLSLFSIFLGDGSVPQMGSVDNNILTEVGPFVVFAIFFPAVTGFTAGVAMSGDLKDPKKSIPLGTMGSIAVGLVIYLILGVFIYFSIGPEVLLSNPLALFEMALIPILVYIGVWGATLSSALGGILGGPRILQAMSVDKITPSIFATGVGKDNEPRNALILTVIIAWGGVLIGDLNVIAEVVSMFYLAAYGFINLSFFLESWASSDFNPTFKVKKWIGLLGFIATFTIMSQLNVLAMIVAIVIIGGIFYFLSRRQVALGTGDIWQSVWSTIVKKGLKRMEAKQDHKRNWKPNTLLFSAGTEYRTKMIEFSKAVSGQNGIITNFDLIENEQATVLFPKSKEIVEDEELEKYGIFGRKLEVQNTFRGIESIACTFGFSGVEPNTALMSWPGETEHPIWFAEMTQKLIDLDYNVLYLDYDERWGFRKQERIDLWWRGVSNNSELMLLLAKFILSSPDWSQANIRVLIVNETNVDSKIIENRIQYVLDQYRITASIKIVNNELDKKSIYELMKVHSSNADLVLVGIPEIEEKDATSFVKRTNNLVKTIGTTLLVKASSQFEETDLKIEHIEIKAETEKIDETNVIPLEDCQDDSFDKIAQKFDGQLNTIVHSLTENSVQRIENYHHRIFSQVIEIMDLFLDKVSPNDALPLLHEKLNEALFSVEEVLNDAVENQLPIVSEEFKKDITLYINHKEDFIHHLPTSIGVNSVFDGNHQLKPAKRKVKFRSAVQRIWYSEGMLELYDQFLEFGYQNLILLHQSKNLLHTVIWDFLTVIRNADEIKVKVKDLKNQLNDALEEIDKDALNLSANFYKRIRNKERENINQLNKIILEKKYAKVLAEKYAATGPSTVKALRKELFTFPTHWSRNINVFTSHLIGDVQLMKFSARIQAFSDESVHYTSENYLTGLQNNISQLAEEIQLLERAVKKGDIKSIVDTDVILSEEIFLNSEQVVGRLIDSINTALEDVSAELELMTSFSINEIRDHQGKNVKTNQVSLRDIAEYLVKKEFEDPIHEQIQLFYEQLKRAIGKLINGSNLIQTGLDNYASTENLKELEAALENAKIEIKESETQVETAQEAFSIELRDRREGLKKELDINQIIEQLDSLSQYVKQHKRRSGIKELAQSFNKVIGTKVRSGLNYFVQKQQDLTASTYKRKYKTAVSEQGILGDFMDSISQKTELPFYYQQLYAASAYSEGGLLENRKFELDQIKSAIQRIKAGSTGAITILGGAGSGKSFLTMHVANYMLKGKTYHVYPPINKSRKKEDLLKAIKRATASKEGLSKLMGSIPAKSSFVFQDLERWWMKSKDGHIVLDEIAKMISTYGNQHYFVINANIHSYQLMVQHSHIQSAVARSVILAPLTVAQIREAIWSRHKTGGLIAHINGDSERHISLSKINKFLSRYHASSNGVLGTALSQWIASIQDKKDNDLEITAPKTIDFPALMRVELKNLIYQLFIHHSLTQAELVKLYGKEHSNWLDRAIQLLLLSGMLKKNEREALYIDSVAKPYVENWLNELGFIK